MFTEFKKNVTSYQSSTGPFFCAIVLFSITTAVIIVVLHDLWSLPSKRCIVILNGNYSFDGKIEFGGSTVHYELEYGIPAGSLERFSIQGPLKRGIASGPPDFALTLCGGDTSCETAETITCTKELDPNRPNCARLADTVTQVDGTTPDPGTKISRTLTAINEHMNRYVVVVEANGERFAEPIGPICVKSVGLPSA